MAARWSCTPRERVSGCCKSGAAEEGGAGWAAGGETGAGPGPGLSRLSCMPGAGRQAAAPYSQSHTPVRLPPARPVLVAGTPHQPGVVPTATVLPIFNSMALFKVQPGRSFHSIQVTTDGVILHPAAASTPWCAGRRGRRRGGSCQLAGAAVLLPPQQAPAGPPNDPTLPHKSSRLPAHSFLRTGCVLLASGSLLLAYCLRTAGGVHPGQAAHEHPGLVPFRPGPRRRRAGHAQPAAAAGGGGHGLRLCRLHRWGQRYGHMYDRGMVRGRETECRYC